MNVLFTRFNRFQAVATAVLLLSLLVQIAGCDSLHPSASQSPKNDGLSHQPATFHQMEQLVMPDDPAVKQALHDALNSAQPAQTPGTINGVNNNPSPATSNLNDFELIVDWVNTHCVYTTDQDNYGVPDYWASPAESIARGSGDCEDYAILLCSLLRAYGVPADQVYVAVGHTQAGEVHSWLVEKYYTGIWCLLDSQRGSTQPFGFASLLASDYTTSFCFNDTAAFYGEPALPAGVYEFESPATTYPLDSGASAGYVTSGQNTTFVVQSPNTPSPAGSSAPAGYGRYLSSGQKITAQVDWLPYSMYWPFNPNILQPWSFNIYDAKGHEVFTWSGMDKQKTLDYTVSQTGMYRIEIVKRDNPARPVRLTLDPQEGWTTGTPLRIDLLRVAQPPFPDAARSAVIEPPPETSPAVWQDETPRIPAPVEVPVEQLVQRALDTINAERASQGLAPIELGNNTAAQQHADDMLAHDFVSSWGIDGTTPDERYSLAGGQGTQNEYEQSVDIEWQGNPSLFSAAVLAAVELALKDLGVYSQGFYMVSTGSSSVTPVIVDTEQFKMQPDRVNIGIAYDGQHLYLVLQYESFYVTYSQLPTIHNGVLSFAGECAPGISTYNIIAISYRPPPGPLTAAQISYASFLDPHWVPLDLPPFAVTGFNLNGLLNALNLPSSYTVTRISNVVQGSVFTLTTNLSAAIAKFGKGVYSIYITGENSTATVSFGLQSSYDIFIE